MNPDELKTLASVVYGPCWQSALSRDMGVALRTVQRWAQRGVSKQATAEGVRRFLDARRVSRVTPPPEGSIDERDDACAAAMKPGVIAILCAARNAGWSTSEACAAMLSIIVDEMISGDEYVATLSILNGALASVEASKGS
ncbi:MAG: hypothetical protein N2444_00540 [Methylocystis sp.]|nr:hypothetical protein [Methylocystis sp.]